jgi:hypothetical protein
MQKAVLWRKCSLMRQLDGLRRRKRKRKRKQLQGLPLAFGLRTASDCCTEA